jgi:hypothetical protein
MHKLKTAAGFEPFSWDELRSIPEKFNAAKYDKFKVFQFMLKNLNSVFYEFDSFSNIIEKLSSDGKKLFIDDVYMKFMEVVSEFARKLWRISENIRKLK